MSDKPSTVDQNLLAELIASDSEIETIIPVDPFTFLPALRRLMTAGAALSKGSKRWKIILGKYAAEAKRSPGLWKHEYQNYGDFFHKEIVDKMGAEASTAYTWKRLAETLPNASIDQLEAIPVVNLGLAASLADGKNEKEREEILQKAHDMPTEQYRAWAESGKHAGPGDLTRRSITFDGTEAQVFEMNKILAMPGFAEWAGTNNRIDMALMSFRASTAEFGGSTPHAKLVHAYHQYLDDRDAAGLFRRMLEAVHGEHTPSQSQEG